MRRSNTRRNVTRPPPAHLDPAFPTSFAAARTSTLTTIIVGRAVMPALARIHGKLRAITTTLRTLHVTVTKLTLCIAWAALAHHQLFAAVRTSTLTTRTAERVGMPALVRILGKSHLITTSLLDTLEPPSRWANSVPQRKRHLYSTDYLRRRGLRYR